MDGGTFLMGTEDAPSYTADGEGPVREVEVALLDGRDNRL